MACGGDRSCAADCRQFLCDLHRDLYCEMLACLDDECSVECTAWMSTECISCAACVDLIQSCAALTACEEAR